MAFITKVDLKAEMVLSGTAHDDLMDAICITVQNIWDQLTNKTWESASYVEILDGTGSQYLFLNNPIVTKISKVSTEKSGAIYIKNTNATSYATVNINETSLVLNYNGTEDTILFATYTTIADVVTQINAAGDGWTASYYDGYGAYLSAELVQVFGVNCIDSTVVDLDVFSDYMDSYTLDPKIGAVFSHSGFISGFQNISVSYTAGYSATTLPKGIKQLLVRQSCHWFRQGTMKTWDYSKIDKFEGGTVDYKKVESMNLLPDFIQMASMNRKINV